MAQESVQLNKNLLKHLRNQKGETQTKSAEACFIGVRQYQNIEKDGYTTTRVTQSIAKHFSISSDELMTDLSEDNSLWYVTNPGCTVGSLGQGYDKALNDIKKLTSRADGRFNPRLTLNDGEQVKEISITVHDQKFTWILRPVELNEKIGLIWVGLSDWQKGIWRIIREELLYGCADDVHLNGTPLVPEGVTPKFIVEFREFAQQKIIHTGYRIFDSAAEFRVSLTQWLDALPMFVEPTHSEVGMFNMIYDFEGEKTKAICIYKVWMNEDGERIQAPWSVSNIKHLIEAITDRKSEKRNWALPIAIGENFEGEDVSPIEPYITYQKVTDLSGVSMTFEEE